RGLHRRPARPCPQAALPFSTPTLPCRQVIPDGDDRFRDASSDVEVACSFGFQLRCMRRSPKGRSPDFSKYGLARENCMSGDVTEVLAGFAASLQYDDLPGHVKDHCKNVLLDTLACAVAGHRGEETEQLAALASALAQSSESSV